MAPKSSKTPGPEKPAETRLSATILLLRDGPEQLEVFMVERHHKIDFAEGALVFPGGKVETRNAAPELEAFCCGADSGSENENSVPVAAIRETFEECGVLLARPLGTQDLVDGTRLESISVRYRDEFQNGHSHSVEDTLENARHDTIVTLLPRFSKDPDGTMRMVIPEEAGYDTVREPIPGARPGPGGGK